MKDKMFLRKGDIIKEIIGGNAYLVLEEDEDLLKNALIVTKVDLYGITRNYQISTSFTTLDVIKDEADIEDFNNTLRFFGCYYNKSEKEVMPAPIYDLADLKDKLLEFIDHPDKFDVFYRKNLKECVKNL